MSEDWNLKKKGISLPYDDEDLHWDDFYTVKDIDILKDKLMEDIEELNNRTHRYNRTFNWHHEVKEIIEKRFGKD